MEGHHDTIREFIGQSRNGERVYIDPQETKVALHLAEAPQLRELITEVLEKVDLVGDNVAIEKDLGRTVGETTLVETDDNDEIIYAKRLQRDKYTRFVVNKMAQPTQFVTVILHKTDEGYRLWSAWCGQLVPTSPGGDDEMPKSQGFWRNHALVYDETIIQLDTVTATCPWD
jgi:hypothetical protein